MKFVGLFVLFLAVGCGTSPQGPGLTLYTSPGQSFTCPANNLGTFSPQNFIYNTPNWNGKRFIFIHGSFDTNHVDGLMSNPDWYNIVRTLNNLGWQVIEFDRPSGDVDQFNSDNGQSYAQNYSNKLDQIVSCTDATYGKATQWSIGGVSYGGLHTLMGVILKPNFFYKYLALVPVVEIGWLTQFNGYEPSYFDPTLSPQSFKNVQGYIGYSTNDMTVNFILTQNFITQIRNFGANVQITQFINAGHTTSGDLTPLANWLNQ